MKEFFPGISKIAYEGPDSDNPLAFKYYDADRKVGKKTLKEHLRFSVVCWHTFKTSGADPFGGPVYDRPWDVADDPLDRAEDTLRAAFEFFAKLGNPFYCWHDRDIAPEGNDLQESNARLDRIVALAKKLQRQTGVKLLWGTSNCFSHPRYTHGAGTNPDAHVFAYAASQIKKAMECTRELGGSNYVFWGGREGYSSLLNTDMAHEQDQMARFLEMAVEHKKKIGFKGTLLLEPKPKEPTKHQYDYDAATVLGFLRKYGLQDEFKLNIEANHATLAGHSFEHELAYATSHGIFGSVDMNRGDPQNGWDTDQFPNNIPEVAMALYIILKAGGLTTGGLNFDAKLRRQSVDPADLFHAHIGGMDTCARALVIAAAMLEDGKLDGTIDSRYGGWDDELGKGILDQNLSMEDLSTHVLSRNIEPQPRSGRQEYLENVVNRYL